jgi:hypothetical protein
VIEILDYMQSMLPPRSPLQLLWLPLSLLLTKVFSFIDSLSLIHLAVTEKTANASVNLYREAFKNFKTLIFQPIKFLTKPTFAFVCLVYSATYIAANTITTYCELNDEDPYWPKMIGTTATNMGLGILKDRYFARVFNGKAPPVFPLASWGLFCVRDLLTIGAGFNFPDAASSFLQQNNYITNPVIADRVSQVSVPMAAQLILSPIHVLSLDIYNRVGQSWRSRYGYIKGIYLETSSMRMGRVCCAYGIAGVSNKNLKASLRAQFAR